MTKFMQSVVKRVEELKKLKRKRVIEAKKSNIGFTAIQRTLTPYKTPTMLKRKRITTKSQYIKHSTIKAGLKLGREK